MTGVLGRQYAGGLAGFAYYVETLTNCTATVTGELGGQYVGGLVGGVYLDGGTMTLTDCTAKVEDSLTAEGEYGNAGGLVGYVDENGTMTLTDCAVQAVITNQEGGSYAPSGPVGDGTAKFSGTSVTTLRMGAGSSVYLALVNDTALTLTDTGVLKAAGYAASNGITGSVEVTSDGGAEIRVHGGSDPDGRTYTLTGVNGTLRLEDKSPAEYWVTLDASFGTSDADPLAKGDKVNLLGEAGNRLCTVSVKAGTGGRAGVSNGGPVIAGTEEVTVTAIPDSGYRFVGWTEDGQLVSTEASYAFTVTSSRTLTAVFEVITPQYTVTVRAGTGGSATGGGTVSAGTRVTVTATPDSGYHFVNWTESDQQVSTEASYTFEVTASRTLTAVFERTSSGGGSSGGGGDTYTPPKKDEPQTGSSGGWKDIQKELENTKPGDNVDVAMNGATEVPKEVLEDIAGKDVEVSFDMGGGIVWTVNGKDIPAGIGSLNLGIKTGSSSIPVNVVNAITGEKSTMQFTLAHSGPFGTVLHLSLNLGATNRGYWANLYWFDEGGKELVFQHSCRIDEEGTASWPFDHASSYAVVIDEKNHDPAWENPFTDVSEGDWYYEAVRFVHEQGLMNGYSDGRFGPNDTLSRAQLAQILFNREGRPVVNYLMQFDDVAGEAWYTEAVRWAASQGIVGGYGNGTFGPNDPITREQLAVMLWRYSGSPAASSKELYFNDTDEISGFALEALRWAVENGILNGYGDGRLGPQGQATRAQVAQMLKNFIENQEEENT